MLSLRAGPRLLVPSTLLACALPVAAQVPCPGVCIGFAAAGGVASVPLSPAAMLLLSLLVAGAAYVAMRRRSGLMAFLLAAALAGAAMTTEIRQAIAASLYQVVLGAGNMASVTLPASYVGPVDVQNPQNVPVTITAITVGTDFALDPASPLHVGSVIPPGGTVSGAVVIAAADSTPPTLLSASNLGSTNIGQGVTNTLTFDEAIGSATVGTIPIGMTVTATPNGSTVSLQIATNGSFTAFGSVSIPVTVGDTTSPANTAVVNVTKVVNDVAPQGSNLGDLSMGDSAGFSPMYIRDSNGNPPVWPISAGEITNPVYIASATCFVGAGTPVPNCFDPIHSYWGINTTATDPAGRTLTYSMVVTSPTSLPDQVISMQANLNIDPNAGLITQTCSAGCFDAFGPETYSVTVTVQPSGGTLPLIRTFHLDVRDDG